MTWIGLFWLACGASLAFGWILCGLLTKGKLRRRDERIRRLEAENARLTDDLVGDGTGFQVWGK